MTVEYNKRKSIAALFVMWPRQVNEQPEEVLARSYEKACLYCHPWALDRAVRRFIHGEVKGHAMAFRPTAPQVAQLAQTIQGEEHRFTQMQERIHTQSRAIEFSRGSKEERDRRGDLWRRMRHELSQPNIHELAQAYVANKLSVPGTKFDITGATFPDGTHHDIEEMRTRVAAIGDSR